MERKESMIDPEKTNDYFVKLTGKGNIPVPLEIGRNYEIKVQGTVTSTTESDKHDGTHSVFYRFEPVLIEATTDKGESIKARDTRGLSQLFRASQWKFWSNNADGEEFEAYYNRLMMRLIQNPTEIGEMYGKN